MLTFLLIWLNRERFSPAKHRNTGNISTLTGYTYFYKVELPVGKSQSSTPSPEVVEHLFLDVIVSVLGGFLVLFFQPY